MVKDIKGRWFSLQEKSESLRGPMTCTMAILEACSLSKHAKGVMLAKSSALSS